MPAEQRAAEHLANERTFLAWVRTNIAVISLGFVLARIGPVLPVSGKGIGPRLAAKALPLGIGMVGFGAVLTLLAAWRYAAINRGIETGRIRTDRVLVRFVTVAVILLVAGLIAYMLATQ